MSLDDLQLRRAAGPTLRQARRPCGPLRVALFTGNYNYTRDGATQALQRLVGRLESMLLTRRRVPSATTVTAARQRRR